MATKRATTMATTKSTAIHAETLKSTLSLITSASERNKLFFETCLSLGNLSTLVWV